MKVLVCTLISSNKVLGLINLEKIQELIVYFVELNFSYIYNVDKFFNVFINLVKLRDIYGRV